MKFIKISLTAISMLFLSVSHASPVELIVDNGQLMGADNVPVGNSLFDVRFLDGTCIEVFSGCDDLSDFTFDNIDDAALASQALLEFVFVDGNGFFFDSETERTNGCDNVWYCTVATNYRTSTQLVHYMGAINSFAPTADGYLPFNVNRDYDFTRENWEDYWTDLTWAVWSTSATSSVSVPSIFVLLVFGIVGLLFVPRRFST